MILHKEGEADSPCLCQHWGGNEFHETVREFVADAFKNRERTTGKVEDRWEPSRLFVKLVIALGSGGYIECDPNRVDDSDYGCLHVTMHDDGPEFSL